MADFMAKLDPLTGKMEWVPRDKEEGEDAAAFAADLLASSYGDMLQDTERNRLYAAAIGAAVAGFKEVNGRAPRVLDIGTGTGLLSMMAVQAGATDVTACEAFPPMAEVARQVIADNGMADRITLVPQRSTDMEPLAEERRAELVVSEILDTELIGEGVLGTMRHAHAALLAPNAVVIPRSATIRAVLVQSEHLRGWHDVSAAGCFGAQLGAGAGLPPGRMVDVHAEALEGRVEFLCEPFDAQHFDFTTASELTGATGTAVTPIKGGTVDAVLLWWDCHLDRDNCLSTAPPWVDRSPGRCWRDHWRQAVYLLAGAPTAVELNVPVSVTCAFDEYTLWFALGEDTATQPPRVDPPWALWSPTRIGALNNAERRATLETRVRAVCTAVRPGECLLGVGDGSLVALAAASHWANEGREAPPKIFSHEPNEMSRRHTARVLSKLKLSRAVQLLDAPDLTAIDLECLGGARVGALIAEPYYLSTLLPWHALQFWYAADALRTVLSPTATISPRAATLLAMCVEFEHLHQTQARVRTVAGCNLEAYDAVTAPHAQSIGPVPLWEYAHTALTKVTPLLRFDLCSTPAPTTATLRMPVTTSGNWNAVVCWLSFTDDDVAGGDGAEGLHQTCPEYERSAVQFVPEMPVVDGGGCEIALTVTFDASACEVKWEATLERAHCPKS